MTIKPNDKLSQFVLGRVSRRVSSKGYHDLFISLGLSPNIIETKSVESPKQAILVLFIEWMRVSNSPYQKLVDALQEHQHYTVSIDEVNIRF